MFLSNDPPDGGTHMTELEKKKKNSCHQMIELDYFTQCPTKHKYTYFGFQ